MSSVAEDRQGDSSSRYCSPKRDFTKVPDGLLRNCPDLNDGEKLTLLTILSYAWDDGECFPLQQTLADNRGVDVRTIRRHLSSLKRKSYITTSPRNNGKSHVIRLLPKAGGGSLTEERADSDVRDQEDDSVRQNRTDSSTIKVTNVKTQRELENPLIPPQSGGQAIASHSPAESSEYDQQLPEEIADLLEHCDVPVGQQKRWARTLIVSVAKQEATWEEIFAWLNNLQTAPATENYSAPRKWLRRLLRARDRTRREAQFLAGHPDYRSQHLLAVLQKALQRLWPHERIPDKAWRRWLSFLEALVNTRQWPIAILKMGLEDEDTMPLAEDRNLPEKWAQRLSRNEDCYWLYREQSAWLRRLQTADENDETNTDLEAYLWGPWEKAREKLQEIGVEIPGWFTSAWSERLGPHGYTCKDLLEVLNNPGLQPELDEDPGRWSIRVQEALG